MRILSLKIIAISEIGARCFDKAVDPIPAKFSRHAIVHRPTKRQFSKTDEARGLLCVASLMACCFDLDFIDN